MICAVLCHCGLPVKKGKLCTAAQTVAGVVETNNADILRGTVAKATTRITAFTHAFDDSNYSAKVQPQSWYQCIRAAHFET